MRMGGGAKPFGVDAERVPALVRAILDGGAEWRGFHIFVGSQALSADALIEAQRATLALADGLAGAVGEVPPLVNLGGRSEEHTSELQSLMRISFAVFCL